jgi:hypothetical protein
VKRKEIACVNMFAFRLLYFEIKKFSTALPFAVRQLLTAFHTIHFSRSFCVFSREILVFLLCLAFLDFNQPFRPNIEELRYAIVERFVNVFLCFHFDDVKQ